MAVRESRRPGEDIFDHLDRTTHPDAFMHTASGDRDCCRRNHVGPVAEKRAHPDFSLYGKGY